jgi:hypothetical protein
MNEYDEYNINELKKDVERTYDISNSLCYKCSIFFLCLFIFSFALPMLITSFETTTVLICFPFFLICFISLILLTYYHYKKIKISRNIYYSRVKISLTNELGFEIKVLDIPSSSACFHLTWKDIYNHKYTLHVCDKFNKNTNIDLRKMYMEKKAPKFYWYFEDIQCFGYNLDRELKELIGEEMVVGYDVLFSSKEKEKHLKIFKGKNFISFALNSYIRCFAILIIILLEFIFFAIFLSVTGKYSNKNNTNTGDKTEEDEDEGSLVIGIMPGLNNIIFIFLIVFFWIYFSNHKKRLDIFVEGKMIFIGITSFSQKSYKKLYNYENTSIENYYLTLKDCNRATLSLKLEGGKIQKICDFSNEIREDLVFLDENLKKLIN